ncbi:MAG: DUF1428 domain-containing protein [Patescibacteria group bacterium]
MKKTKSKKKVEGNYVDGFVLTVPKTKLNVYKRMAKEGRDMWMKRGALEYRECFADDMRAPWSLAFPKLTKAKKNEIVVFSWIVYKSRADRNRINKEIMDGMKEYEKKNKKKTNNMPFDMKKMAYGGFKIIVRE